MKTTKKEFIGSTFSRIDALSISMHQLVEVEMVNASCQSKSEKCSISKTDSIDKKFTSL